jgi:cytochrome c
MNHHRVSLSVDGNQTFFFSENTIHYQTNISDKEDGTLGKGISSDAVAFSIDYLSQGFDYAAIMVTHGEASRFAIAKSLMAQSDCRTCHNEKEKGVGPSFDQIANKYKSNPKAPEVIDR